LRAGSPSRRRGTDSAPGGYSIRREWFRASSRERYEEPPMPTAPDLRRLIDLVARLRAPDGCPWDREQRLGDLRAYLLEEAHEVAAAIDEEDWAALAGELGDLLFQAAFLVRLAEEKGVFDLAQVVDGIHAKMVARHPHVFGGETLADAQAVRDAWERRKLREEPARDSHLAGVPASLPSLLAAYRLSQKAAGVGFDWPDAAAVLAKVHEEVAELEAAAGKAAEAAGKAAKAAGKAAEAAQEIAEEIGDLLFTVANLSRKLDVDPEAALAAANRKFRRRFAAVERRLAGQGKRLGEATLAELDALWDEVKLDEGRPSRVS
jgi:MazG family protein